MVTSASFLAEILVSSPRYFFSLSRKIFSGSKYPKNIQFDFEKGSIDGDIVLTERHLLSLGVASIAATQPCQCGVTDADHLYYAMVCKLTAGMAMSRHDAWLST